MKVTVSDGEANGDLGPGDADAEISVIIRLTDDTTDNDAVVNRAPYFNFNEGDGLRTTRTVDENTAAKVRTSAMCCVLQMMMPEMI